MNRTIKLYQLCADWHSGQSSRGYRLLCKLARRLRRHGYNTMRLPDPNDSETITWYRSFWNRNYRALKNL